MSKATSHLYTIQLNFYATAQDSKKISQQLKDLALTIQDPFIKELFDSLNSKLESVIKDIDA